MSLLHERGFQCVVEVKLGSQVNVVRVHRGARVAQGLDGVLASLEAVQRL